MNVVNVDVAGSTNKCVNTIMLGIRGETQVTEVQFDIAELVNTYGDGNAQLLVKRATDEVAYPVVISRVENVVVWVVSDVDTAVAGNGRCELWYYVDDALAKTIVYDTYTQKDIGDSSEDPPPGYEGWVDEVINAGLNAVEAAAKAEGAVAHYPKIVDGYWYVWDVANEEWSNTGERATADVSFQNDGIVINT